MSCLRFKTQLKAWKINCSLNHLKKEGWHYLTLKELSALLRGVTSAYNGAFCCLNCLLLFRANDKLELDKKLVKIKLFIVLQCHLKKYDVRV